MSDRAAHHGAKQPHIFSHERAEVLDDPEREAWLPTAQLVAMADPRDGATLLDFGAGTGRYAIAFARANPRASIDAYDVQPEFVELIARRASEAALENLHAVGRLERRYDRIFAANVLHEIGDEDLRMMHEALAPGGSALIIDWNAAIDRPTGPPREHAHTPGEALDRLRDAGFTHIKTIEEPKLPYHFIFEAR